MDTGSNKELIGIQKKKEIERIGIKEKIKLIDF